MEDNSSNDRTNRARRGQQNQGIFGQISGNDEVKPESMLSEGSRDVISMDEGLEDLMVLDSFDDFLDEINDNVSTSWGEKVVEPVYYDNLFPSQPPPTRRDESKLPKPRPVSSYQSWGSLPSSFDEQMQLAMALSLQAQDEKEQDHTTQQPVAQDAQPQPQEAKVLSRANSENELRASMIAGFQALKERHQQLTKQLSSQQLKLQASLQTKPQPQQQFPLFTGRSSTLNQFAQNAPTLDAAENASNIKKRSLPMRSSSEGSGSAPHESSRKKPKLEGSPTEGSYACPLCDQEGLKEMEMLPHVLQDHKEITSRPARLVCPMCALMPGGNPNYKSRDYYGHLNLRHRPRSYEAPPPTDARFVTSYIPSSEPPSGLVVESNSETNAVKPQIVRAVRAARRATAVTQGKESAQKKEDSKRVTRSQTKKSNEKESKEEQEEQEQDAMETDTKKSKKGSTKKKKDSDVRDYFKVVKKKGETKQTKGKKKKEVTEKEKETEKEKKKAKKKQKAKSKEKKKRGKKVAEELEQPVVRKPSVFIRRRIFHNDDDEPGFNPLVNSNPGVLMANSRSRWRDSRHSDDEGATLLDYLLQMEETQDAVRLASSSLGASHQRCDSCSRRLKKNQTRDVLPCGHSFHSTCIDEIVEMEGTVNPSLPACPLCEGY